MATWIWVTIIAAVSQSLRTAQQKNLKESLGDLGASYVRFSYAIPFSWAWIAFYSFTYRQPLPAINVEYLFWITVAGIMQIIFTVLRTKIRKLPEPKVRRHLSNGYNAFRAL